MSKGGSLRISAASKEASGARSRACARYQSSSLSVSESRPALACTRPLEYRSPCSQNQT